MTIRYLLRLTPIVALLACLAAPASADTPSNAVYVRNPSKSTLHFQFGCVNGTTRNYTIGPKTGFWLWNDNGCRHYTVLQRTADSDGNVTHTLNYTLTAGYRYEFFFNDGYWDMGGPY